MARLRLEFHFQLESLWVAQSALGSVVEFERDGYLVQVRIPRDSTDFATTRRYGMESISGMARQAQHNAEAIRPVSIVQVGVCVDSEASWAIMTKPMHEELHDELSHKVIMLWNAARPIAEKVIAEFLDWIRVLYGQAWLGVHGEKPQMLPGSILDEDANEQLPIAFQQGRSVIHEWPGTERALDYESLRSIAEHLGRSAELPVAESLLADALHFVCAEPPDPQRGILSAAIASEVKVRRVLRERARPDVVPVVDLVLENYREIPVAALMLFDKAMKAVTGRSLREGDSRLFRMVKRLFELRNKVAHRGQVVTLGEAQEVVFAARDTFQWLDAL